VLTTIGMFEWGIKPFSRHDPNRFALLSLELSGWSRGDNIYFNFI